MKMHAFSLTTTENYWEWAKYFLVSCRLGFYSISCENDEIKIKFEIFFMMIKCWKIIIIDNLMIELDFDNLIYQIEYLLKTS